VIFYYKKTLRVLINRFVLFYKWIFIILLIIFLIFKWKQIKTVKRYIFWYDFEKSGFSRIQNNNLNPKRLLKFPRRTSEKKFLKNINHFYRFSKIKTINYYVPDIHINLWFVFFGILLNNNCYENLKIKRLFGKIS
jgi:hypothetical protein